MAKTAEPLNYAIGQNLPFNGSELLQNFDFINLSGSKGKSTITLAKHLDSSGGATSINSKGGNVQLFSQGQSGPGMTTSFQAGKTKFFTTPTDGSQQSVDVSLTKTGAGRLKVTQAKKGDSRNALQQLSQFSLVNWLVVAGVVVGAYVVYRSF